jgi:hypothetical protein
LSFTTGLGRLNVVVDAGIARTKGGQDGRVTVLEEEPWLAEAINRLQLMSPHA